MNDLIELIQWTIEHPLESLVALMFAYVFLFGLYNQKRFKNLAKAMAIPFVIYDALINITAMSILMLELPQEWLVTARLKRYKRDYAHGDISYLGLYRFYIATKLCRLANKFDAGHC